MFIFLFNIYISINKNIMQSFKIINPTIIGGFNPTVEAVDENEAATKAWNSISEHITGNVPTFLFTMENTGSRELVSFRVDENRAGKYADYSITEIETKLTPAQQKKFKAEISRLDKMSNELKKQTKQNGGRKRHHLHRHERKDDSSSSSSSSDDDSDNVYDKLKLFKYINQPKPIVYWWYSPVIYGCKTFYCPTLNAPMTPYIEINLSSAFLG